jgi:hypothetical protein
MMRSAFGLSLLVSAGVMVVGCGDSGSSGGTGGTGGSGCETGQVECDGACIPEIDPVLEGAQGIQENIFSGPGATGSCAASSCHDSQNPQPLQQGLDLSSAAASRATLIEVESVEVSKLRVEPGNVEGSYIVNKILGEGIAPGTARMPNIGIPLCDAKIEAIIDWVADGAP